MVTHQYAMNSADTFLTDALRGFVAAHPSIGWESDPGFLLRADRDTDESGQPKVALVSGGGSGHEPMHAGLIGAGLLDAACPGLVFTSPNAAQVAAATRWADRGAGVVHIVKNYTGDVMNFRTARTMLADEVATDEVLVDDDVATDAGDPGRRGTGATVLVEKVCGAAAAAGADLDEVVRLGREAAADARSMAVAYAACTVPGATGPSFDLAEDELEFGVGIHGEAGIDRIRKVAAAELVRRMDDRICAALELADGDEVVCLVNGLGAAHPLELYLVFGEVVADLGARGISVVRSMVGSYVTALDMSGFSITLLRATPQRLTLLDAPTTAPAWPRSLGGPAELTDTSTAEPADAADSGPANTWLTAFVTRVSGSIDELTELDRRAGDGDFGANMRAALAHFGDQLSGSDAEVLQALSTSYLIRAGGTSGAVFGVLFAALAEAFSRSEVAARDALADGAAEALAKIIDLGGAAVGDNTMVDALAPAADALRDGASLADAADRAEQGAESTRDIVASKGRASYVGEKARGVIDPGALVTAWLFRAAAEHDDTHGRP